ncbi:S8 family serine peptidase [Rheinheimera sp. MM224]|uniref:S8 family serine peptidase n=1 Tax=Rheinheimera sp. MM224 TaxID=3019969 RepID=UPI0021F8CB93|nr:S8 family serine peptidase [Rheinheimera sp. MM224]CAI3805970.1 N-acetylneuraminate epimerase [Rheinheimera sp. MM224]
MSSLKKTKLYSALLVAGLGFSIPATAITTAPPEALTAQAMPTEQSILVKVDALQKNYKSRQATGQTKLNQQQLVSLLPETFRHSLKKQQLTIQRIFPLSGLVELKSTKAGAVLPERAALLADISYASVNYSRQIQGTVKRPVDEIYTVLWGLDDYGQYNIANEAYGLGDRDINAPEAWGIRTDASNVLVAVFDNGANASTDIVNNLWTNPGEIAFNYEDDDNNGYVDDIYGIAPAYDWQPGEVGNHLDGHGLQVAGIIAAEGNNEYLTTGAAWKAQLMILKVSDESGNIKDAYIIEGIEYLLAAKQQYGLDRVVINLSFGQYTYSEALNDALQMAADEGVLIVAAAGNANQNNDYKAFYPASADIDNIVSVGAAAVSYKGKVTLSNQGCSTVDVMAPGENIWTLSVGGKANSGELAALGGSSASAALVSGIAALTWAEHPDWDWREVKNALLNAAQPLDDLAGLSLSSGLIKADKALQHSTTAPVVWQLSDNGFRPGETITISGDKFGTSGQVTLIQGEQTSQLKVLDWQEKQISVELPKETAYGQASLVVSTAALHSANVCLPVADNAEHKGSLVTARSFPAAALIDNDIWVFGGNTAVSTTSSVEKYNLTTHVAESKSEWAMPIAIEAPAYGVINGKVYLAGGFAYNVATYNTVQIFDPKTGQWTTGATMPEPVAYAASVVYQNKLYVFGGLNSKYSYDPTQHDDISDKVYAYDPAANSWSQVATLEVPLKGSAATVSPDGKGIILAGGQTIGEQGAVKTVQQLDVTTGQWQDLPDMLEARSNFSLLTHNDAIYALFGTNGTTFFDGGFRDSSATAETLIGTGWTVATHTDQALYGTAAVKQGEQAFILGGGTSQPNAEGQDKFYFTSGMSDTVRGFRLMQRPEVQIEQPPVPLPPVTPPAADTHSGGSVGAFFLLMLSTALLRLRQVKKAAWLKAIFALSVLPVFSAHAAPEQGTESDHKVTQRVLLKLKDQQLVQADSNQLSAEVKSLLAGVDARVLHIFPRSGVISIATSQDTASVVQELRQSTLVDYAEQDFLRELRATTPNDPDFALQWGLSNIGQRMGTPDSGYYYGIPDRDINALEAWDIRTSAANVVVAVIDSPVETQHPDLVDNMWVNSGEIAGNGIDDDNNGYIDDIHGIELSGTEYVDIFPHGTAVAGVIGAKGDNGQGVTGVAWDVQLMSLAVMDSYLVSDAYAVEAIEYVIAMKEKMQLPRVIINASWGGVSYSQAIYDALAAAQEAGILIIASTSNGDDDADIQPSYPANFDLDHIVAVGAADSTKTGPFFSSYIGCSNVDLMAPGFEIQTTTPVFYGHYQSYSGTSIAAGLVSGVAALVWEQYPDATALDVKAALMNAAMPYADLARSSVTGGMLRADLALTPGMISKAAVWAISPKAAGPGAIISIKGHNFGKNGGQVYLKQTDTKLPLELVSWSESEIKVRLDQATPYGASQIEVVPALSFASQNACFTVAKVPEAIAKMATPRTEAAYAQVGDALWVIGGWSNNSPVTSVERFDLNSKTSSSSTAWAIPVALSGAKAVAVADKIYLLGGFDAQSNSSDRIYLFDTQTTSWSLLDTRLPQTAGYPSVVLAGKKIYVFGGVTGKYPAYYAADVSNQVHVYDTETNQWSQGQDMPTNLAGATADLDPATGLISLYGGYAMPWDNSGMPAVNSVLQFDPATENWSEAEPMLTARGGAAVVRHEGKVHVLFGRTGGGHKADQGFADAETFDGSSWQKTMLATVRLTDPAVAIKDDKVFVLGGLTDHRAIKEGSDLQVWQIDLSDAEAPAPEEPAPTPAPGSGTPSKPVPASHGQSSGAIQFGILIVFALLALGRRRKQ